MLNNNKKPRSVIPAIRDCAVIFAAIVVAWSFLSPSKSESHIVGKMLSDETQAPSADIKKTGKTHFSEPELSAYFDRYSKERVAQINSEGKVVKIGQILGTSTVGQAQTLPQAQAQAQPQAPVQNQGSPNLSGGKGKITQPTLNPPPFVDEEARQSLADRANAPLRPDQVPTFKITHHRDGTRMTRAEQEENVRMALSKIPDEWTITYKSPNERVRAYVFTDPSCPFCKRLHNDLDKLMDAGVTVHYLLYPRDQAQARDGYLSVNASNLANAWCSLDQKAAIDDAFMGYRIPQTNCEDLPDDMSRFAPPVPDHFNLGEYFDVKATPTIFLSNGHSFAGYSSIDRFLSQIR